MAVLVLLRHGESEWNAADVFTGWIDVGLSGHGRRQARRAGELLAERGLYPAVVHTSVQRRAIVTARTWPLKPAAGHGCPCGARGGSWLFTIGLAGIGVALILGIGHRASGCGSRRWPAWSWWPSCGWRCGRSPSTRRTDR